MNKNIVPAIIWVALNVLVGAFFGSWFFVGTTIVGLLILLP